MAVLSRVNFISQMRLDVPDLLAMDSYTAFDFRSLVSFFTDVDKAYVIRGFEVVSKSGLTIGIKVAKSLAFNPQDNNGSFYVGLPDDEDIQLDLPANQTNIFIEAFFSNTTQTPINRGVWDPLALRGQDAAGQEYNSSIDSQNVIELDIRVNTSGFTDGAIPLLKCETSGSGVSKFVDCRPMFFRLGKGGATPDPLSKYNWSSTRNEPVPQGSGVGDDVSSPWRSKDSSGSINDKAFRSLKDVLDAMMTRFCEITGTALWYVTSSTSGTGPVSNISLNQLFFDALGSKIQPSKNAAFKWSDKNGGLRLIGEGVVDINTTTGSYHSGLVTWRSNYSNLEWHLGHSFVITSPSKRNYSEVKFQSPIPENNGNIYLLLERETSKGSGANVKWADNSSHGSLEVSKTVSGNLNDFTGIALGDYIRKTSEGYSRYYKVVKMSDGTLIYDSTPGSPDYEDYQNQIADSTIVALELESVIESGYSEEPLRYFRSRYSSDDLYADTIENYYGYQDSNFIWLGRRKDNLLFLKDYGTMQEGEEATILDGVFAHGGASVAKSGLVLEHAKEASYDPTSGYSLKTGAGNLLTIKKLKRDNTVEVSSPDNSAALLEYTIDVNVGTIPLGSNLWVRLSDVSGGSLVSGSVTNITDDEDNTDISTNRFEVRLPADTPADTFDNIDVFLLARKVELNSQECLVFSDGSILTAFGQLINTNLDISGDVRLTKYDNESVLFMADDGTKKLDQDSSNFFYRKSEQLLGLFNFRFKNNDLYQNNPEDVDILSNLGSHTATLGTSESTFIIPGDLIVKGDYISENVGNILSEDKLITLGVGNLLNGGGESGIEIADNTQDSSQFDSVVGESFVYITYSLAHGYSIDDVIGVSTYDDIGGITAGQIGGQYKIVATATAVGEAEIISPTEIKVYSRGLADTTESKTTLTPKTFITEWSIQVSDSASDYLGYSSWSFRVKGVSTKPTLTPFENYGIVPTAHTANMLDGRIPFVNNDGQGPGSSDTTINFTNNLKWDNSTNTLTVIGTTLLGGDLIPTVDNVYNIGENTSPLRWKQLFLGSNGIVMGDSNIYELSPNFLQTDDIFKSAQRFITDDTVSYKEYSIMSWPSVPDFGYINIFARDGMIYQQRADGDQKLLTNTQGNVYEELVYVVASPSGGYEMAPISSPPQTVILPKDQKFLIGVTLVCSTVNGSQTVTVSCEDHGLVSGDLISVVTTVDIGGIPYGDLSVTGKAVAVINPNTFTYQADSAATSDETGQLDKVTAEKTRSYIVGNDELEVFLNGVYQRKGFHWDELGFNNSLSNQIIWYREIKLDDVITYRIDSNGGQVIIKQSGGLSLHDSYLLGNTINANPGLPVTIIGTGKVLSITGDMYISGVIDPKAIVFTEESTSPVTLSQNGLWVEDTADKDLIFSRNGLAPITITKDFLYRNGSLPMTGDLDLNSNQIKNLPDAQTLDGHAISKKHLDTELLEYLRLDGSQIISGNIDLDGNKITNSADPSDPSDLLSFGYAESLYLKIDGSVSMSGSLNMATNKISNLGAPLATSDAARLFDVQAVSTQLPNYLLRDGTSVMTGNLNMNSTNRIVNLASPSGANDATNKAYVDSKDRYKAIYVDAINNTGAPIPINTVVAISTSMSGEIIIASASDLSLSEGSIGVASEEIANNFSGKVQIAGLTEVLTSSPLIHGRIAWLDSFNPGRASPSRPTSPGTVKYILGVSYAVNMIILRPQFDGINDNIYEEFLSVISGAPSSDYEITGPLAVDEVISMPPDSRDGGSVQYYIVGSGMLEVYLNGVPQTNGVEFEEVGLPGAASNQIKVKVPIRVDDSIGFRIDQLGTIFIEGSNISTSLQSAYNAGNVINVSLGRPIIINGPIGQKLLEINGDIKVTGVIDPKGLQLTRETSNPFGEGQEGIYLDSTGNLIQKKEGATPINITETIVSASPDKVVIQMYNEIASPIPAQTPISVNRVTGNLTLIDVGNNNISVDAFGVTSEIINNFTSGSIITFGRLENVTGLSYGKVYVSKAGTLTNNVPEIGVDGFLPGDRIIEVGTVVKNSANPTQKDLIVCVKNLGVLVEA